MRRIIFAMTVAAAGALLSACGASTSANPATLAAADPTTPAPTGSAAAATAPAEAPAASPSAATIAEDATAAQVADGLGCAKFERTKINPNQMGPKPVSEGKCTRDGQRYSITVYKDSDDVAATLVIVKMFAGVLTKPAQIGVNGRWVVAPHSKSLSDVSPIGPAMADAIRDSGGRIKTIEPSDKL